MSEAATMLADGFSALADETSGHGVELTLEGTATTFVAVVVPLIPPVFEGQVAVSIKSHVMVSVERSEFDTVPEIGAVFTDEAKGFSYRVVTSEDLPSRPHIVFTCEASKEPA